ncbi:hypothetical protein Mal15_19940 [Stieleria maiorica]|uniref:Uncharacterized protein n=1 Tax=Stieleria maiorica TaxID=2795974 RepID=A0A5B9MA06_9BACT|nr:hypothetical protein [Stieleria maiorica]QEF97948.1 hypothetical protein Mal15_19940 [Stieleria maiorica]
MFPIQLKRIETAIDAGRLDDAFELLIATPQRGHRDGQRLTDLLIDHLVQRARRHLDRQHHRDARSDADKARCLAGRTSEVVNLVSEIAEIESQQRAQAAAEQEAAREAKMQGQLGQFTLGQHLLPPGPTHSRLAAEIERKRTLAAAAADRIGQAIASHDFEAGVAIVQSLDAELRRHRLVVDKIRALLPPILERIVADFESGRLDRGGDGLQMAIAAAPMDARLNELRSCFDRCARANELIGRACYLEADRELALVSQVISNAPWITETRKTLALLADQVAKVRSGPLGLLDGYVPIPTGRPVGVQALAAHSGCEAATGVRLKPGHQRVDERQGARVLRVDGLGTILLLDAERVSVGASSTSQRYDLPLLTEGPSAALFIRRAGEDYFAESEAEFRVNDRPTKRRLLADGDSLGYGRRGRLKFRKTVPASGSAVLQLSGAGLAKREIRCAALMADSLLFSGSGGHFSISGGERPIVVFRSAGGYAIKFAEPGGDVCQLEPDRPVLLGQTRFSLTQVNLS